MSKQSVSVMQDEISAYRAQTKSILDAQRVLRFTNDEFSELKRKYSELTQAFLDLQVKNKEIETS